MTLLLLYLAGFMELMQVGSGVPCSCTQHWGHFSGRTGYSGIPTFATVLSNATYLFHFKWNSCSNILLSQFIKLQVPHYRL